MMKIKFHCAKHSNLLIYIAQILNKLDLSLHNRPHLYAKDLNIINAIPKNSGLIFAVNHSDEMDIRMCMEFARRSKRRFTYMVNSEAFEEFFGIAGWFLQRLGCFSVERGGKDTEAIQYAKDVVKKEDESLVIFPEGEIYYVNDLVQPFKTGVVHIGLQALSEIRQAYPDRDVYLLPVAIKYRYRKTIESALSKRIDRIEKKLLMNSRYLSFQQRLISIIENLSKSKIKIDIVQDNSEELEKLNNQIEEIRSAILAKVESKYDQTPNDHKIKLMSRAQKIIFFLREQLKKKKLFTPETRKQIKEDIKSIKDTIQMAAWQPSYIEIDPSEERLAETVMKLEREVFQKKRPQPLGKRDVFMSIGTPINLTEYIDLYKNEPSLISHQLAKELQGNIQQHIEKLTF